MITVRYPAVDRRTQAAYSHACKFDPCVHAICGSCTCVRETVMHYLSTALAHFLSRSSARRGYKSGRASESIQHQSTHSHSEKPRRKQLRAQNNCTRPSRLLDIDHPEHHYTTHIPCCIHTSWPAPSLLPQLCRSSRRPRMPSPSRPCRRPCPLVVAPPMRPCPRLFSPAALQDSQPPPLLPRVASRPLTYSP